MLAKLSLALTALSLGSVAAAQNYYGGWTPGSEITGQRVQVETNGVTNTILFEADGVARIYSPSGATVVDATWTTQDGLLCLQTASTFDCYPYQTPFHAGKPVNLISNCAVRSRWLAPQVNNLPGPGERG